MRGGLQMIMGKHGYTSPRIDPGLAQLITHVDSLALPNPSDRNGEALLELLRDRALLHTLYYTGMRRQEVADLDRDTVQDGWAFEALIKGKGSKERVVYFDDETLGHVRAYLAERRDTLSPLWLRHDNHRGESGLNGEHWRLSP